MRILLIANASYEPPRGGSTRSNLVWLRELMETGHECQVLCPRIHRADAERVVVNGLGIRRVLDLARHSETVGEEIERFQPDWVLVSSEDVGHTLLRAAYRHAAARLVYLAHTPQFFPFGPQSWHPDPAAAALVRRSAAVIAIGEHMAAYIREHLGREARVIHPPMYGKPPYRKLGGFATGGVLMVNPCAVKGISIFLELARRMPKTPFFALASWGTTSADRADMARVPNIRVLESVPDIEDVLSKASVLVMPSLWFEGFGLIAMEAMLRGIPVVASESGGLCDAKRGTGGLIPVRLIERYESSFDEQHMPRPIIPAQNVEPWESALRMLFSDREFYESEADIARRAAEEFAGGLRVNALGELLAALPVRKQRRYLLAHNSLYFPSHGGGDKSNRMLMEALAAHGHEVRVVARTERFNEEEHLKLLAELAERGVDAEELSDSVQFRRNGVEVRVLTRSSMLRPFFARQIAEFDPDIILTSTDDPAQLLLGLALDAPRARVVHLIRATIAVPFGPHSPAENAERIAMLREVDGAVGVSESVAGYAREYGALDAIHVPISLMDRDSYPQLGRFDNPYVTMVNPCDVKGISIFLGLARTMRHVQFAAVPMWGTTGQDLEALRAEPNITILSAEDNVDRIFANAKVMLVPSIWAEARSRVVVEAMLAGIPVLASDIGGIPEAKLGVPYLLPIRPIEKYRTEVNENMVPVAEVPEQDLGPWRDALERVTGDRTHWEEIAARSRRAALEYAGRISSVPFEEYCESLLHRPKKASGRQTPRWTADKQRLLLLRVKREAESRRKRWFPPRSAAHTGLPRLFCFPYAGAGALAWRGWQESLDGIAEVTPVLLPGRETRAGETPFTRMEELIEALTAEIAPHLNGPFLFFGHSMGAGVAFELTRELRRRGLPMPERLLVSGARAPQLRTEIPAPLNDAELIDRIRNLGGLPPEIAENMTLVARLLPALRADAELYRQYLYSPEPPLDIQLTAFAGAEDVNVGPDLVAPWREQTTGVFDMAVFPGGHFFIRSGEFLRRLSLELTERTMGVHAG